MVDGIGNGPQMPQFDAGALQNAGKGALKGGAEGGLLNKIGNFLSGNKTEAQEKPIKGLSVERSGEQGKKGEAIGCEGTVDYQGTVNYKSE